MHLYLTVFPIYIYVNVLKQLLFTLARRLHTLLYIPFVIQLPLLFS